MKYFRSTVICGLGYGIVTFVLCRFNLSGKLFLPNRPWMSDALGSVIAAIVFMLIWHSLFRLFFFKALKKTAFGNWKEASLAVLAAVMLAESLLIAKALIIGHKPDIVSLIFGGLGIAVGVSIAITIVQGKTPSRPMRLENDRK